MSTDLGYFGPASVTWRVLADPTANIAGVRALFLQALHPLAMAGVHEHSDFATAFWPRLQRTAQYVTTVAYGTTEQADTAAARVRALHQRVRGVDPVTGQHYAASDPELLRWVHATEVDSLVDAAHRGGVGLDGAQFDAFLAEQVRAAERAIGEDRRRGRTARKYSASAARSLGTSGTPMSSAARTCSARNVSSCAPSSPMPPRSAVSTNESTSVACTQRSSSGSLAA